MKIKLRHLILLIALPLLLALLVVVSSFLAISHNYKYHRGIKQIAATEKKGHVFKIKIKCFDYRDCDVTKVEGEEKAYCGEKLQLINSDLGKSIIKVQLYDIEYVTKEFEEIYKPWTTYEVKGSNKQLRFMYCYTSSHGILVYIGSDMQLNSVELLHKRLYSIVFSIDYD